MVAAVVAAVDVPVTVKLSPFYAALPSFVRRLEHAGAAGVVVFNRFYQPDVDLDTLDVDRHLHLSTPAELPLRLHALALLHGRVGLSLAATGGVHSGRDAAKAILCGATAVQIVSALLDGGPGAPRTHPPRPRPRGSTRRATAASTKPAARWRSTMSPTRTPGNASTTPACSRAGKPPEPGVEPHGERAVRTGLREPHGIREGLGRARSSVPLARPGYPGSNGDGWSAMRW